MEMVQSLIVMVTKLSSEVHLLGIDNDTMKKQLHDLQQALPHVPPTRREATSSAVGKSYRDVLCAVDGNPRAIAFTALATSPIPLPEPPIVMGETSSDDFVTLVKKKRVNPSHAAVANKTKKSRVAMIGVRNSSSLTVVQKRVRRKSLFVSRFSPHVTASDVENSLKDQLQLASLVCTRLKTKHNSYASFHVSVAEDDFHLNNNTGVWPNGCLIAIFYGRLNPDQIYTCEKTATSRPPSPETRSLCPPSDHIVDSVNNILDPGEAAPALS
jgi:hypothetical protein